MPRRFIDAIKLIITIYFNTIRARGRVFYRNYIKEWEKIFDGNNSINREV